jgi:NADH:ubiquinone oxidoreductase subunit 6 (subunit J)
MTFVGQTVPPEIPPEVMLILSQLVTDFTAPLRIYGIALLIAGIGLVVLSVKLKSPSGDL